ncbi:hypothetical protein AOLI_G00056340 [Acnodon oligacanthus]
MRTLSALLVLLLLLGSRQLTSSAAPLSADCCVKLETMQIPLSRVKSMKWTSSDCYRKAIVLETVRGKKLCMDPNVAWVKSHVTTLNQRRNKATATPSTTIPTKPSLSTGS